MLKYRYNSKKNTLYLWDQSLSLTDVFNKVWNRDYIEHFRDGGQDVSYAATNLPVEYFKGEALLPYVKVRKEAPQAFINKVKKYVNTYGRVKDHYTTY